ncbi:MAG: hypothetical protein JST54_02405 [Deltaproteobacteria bacterium]|nr:hypothetical protein [Deltaproteobacteria bacterium]
MHDWPPWQPPSPTHAIDWPGAQTRLPVVPEEELVVLELPQPTTIKPSTNPTDTRIERTNPSRTDNSEKRPSAF